MVSHPNVVVQLTNLVVCTGVHEGSSPDGQYSQWLWEASRARPAGRSGIAELVRHVEFLEALDDYDIVLTALPDRAT